MRRRTFDNRSHLLGRTRGVIAGVTVALVVLTMLGSGVAGAVVGQTDTEAERDAVRDRQDHLAGEIDVLLASNAEVEAALDELDAAIATQQSVADAAVDTADAAAAASAAADADLVRADRDVAVLEQAIRDMAVASYIHPPTADLVQSLQASSLSNALVQKAYLDARAERDFSLLDLLEAARVEAARSAVVAADAATTARATADAAAEELEVLRSRQSELATFAGDLEARIDAALAESAALADLDAELSAQIAQEQAELLARLPPPTTIPPTTVPPTTVPAVDERGATTTTAAAADDADEARADTGAGDDEPTEAEGRPRTPPPPLATVRGFTVHADLAPDFAAMLDAAEADGVSFGGSGYRSTDRQIELREAHCGPTEYDIWERPAASCSPPTAKPGTSMHEHGRAVDLTFEGRLITSRDNDGYKWLDEHAGTYGLFNLPSEPWHWSTTGN